MEPELRKVSLLVPVPAWRVELTEVVRDSLLQSKSIGEALGILPGEWQLSKGYSLNPMQMRFDVSTFPACSSSTFESPTDLRSGPQVIYLWEPKEPKEPCHLPGMFLVYSHSPAPDDCMVSLHCDRPDCRTNGKGGMQLVWGFAALANAAKIVLPPPIPKPAAVSLHMAEDRVIWADQYNEPTMRPYPLADYDDKSITGVRALMAVGKSKH